MGHVCQGDFLPGKEHLRSQDDEALSRVFTVENGYRRSPQVKEAGSRLCALKHDSKGSLLKNIECIFTKDF